MKIGFLGFGEASSCIADGLLQTQANLEITAYDVDIERAESVRKQITDYNRITLVAQLQKIVTESDTLIVAIPGKFDESLFEEVCALDIEGKLFIDLCTAKPSQKHGISLLVEKHQAFYVDVAVLGSVPSLKHRVPMMLSGTGALRMEAAFSEFNMDMKIVSEEAGKASLVKLCRSIYMKGLAALSMEMTDVAEAYGVKDLVYESLAKSMDNDEFCVYTPRLINGTKKHLARRSAEVEECIDIIKEVNKNAFVTEATLNTYKSLI